ncbi:MAG: hypothetical protein IJY69_03195 [Clostridia bacterium]|nr:hypothetical protein [Clostridia bacterium]
MIKKKTVSRIIALLLTLGTLVSVFSILANGAESDKLDYSRPGSQYTKTMKAPDIIEHILNTEISEEERAYLLSYSDTEIYYDDGIPTSSVLTDYKDGKLSVSAYEYTYYTEDGSAVVWVPKAAELDGARRELTKSSRNSYDASFDSVSDADDSAVIVITYQLRIEISAGLANSLVNKAYHDGTALSDEAEQRRVEYEQAYAEYLLLKAAHESYVLALDKHEDDKALFLSYLSTKRSYDEALKKHNDYLVAKVAFDSALKAHNKYLEDMKVFNEEYALFTAYLSELREYEQAVELQAPDVANKALCDNQLNIIDTTKTPMTALNRTVYSAVVNSTLVDYVISQRDLYSSSLVGMSEEVVDLAESSTALLRSLLPDFFTLQTDAARYNYYSANYDKFCQGFLGLFQSLYYMAQNKMIIAGIVEMKGMEMLDKFEILVAQLYLVCDALVDGNVKSVPAKYVSSADKKYKQINVTYDNFKIRRSYSQIMGSTVYLSDTDKAKPIDGGYPTIVELVPPTPVIEPTMPEYVKKPTEPTFYAHPGDPPAVVEDPGDPPEFVPEPTAPEKVELESVISNLIDALGTKVTDRGELFDSPVTVTAETTVSKKFLNVSTATVKFYATGASDPDYTVEVDTGTFADYIGPVPHKPEDASAVYRFSGWQTESGELVDLSSVDGDLILYPFFTPITKYYNITWQIDDFTLSEGLPYGATPHYAGVPKKQSDGVYSYTFAGWSPEIQTVTTDATYVAVFDRRELIGSVPGVVISPTDEGGYVFDATGSFVSDFDLTDVLAIREEGTDLTVKTRFGEAYACGESLDAMIDMGITSLSITSTSYGNLVSRYTVSTYDYNGSLVLCPDISIEFSAFAGGFDSSRVSLRGTLQDGSYIYPVYSSVNGVIRFAATPCVEYAIGNEYIVNPVSNEFVSLSTVAGGYFVGESVTVDVTLSPGKSLTKLYYRDSQGNTTAIRGKTFNMPKGDITVIAVTDTSFHTVRFISDGKVVTSYRLAYGKLPTPPVEAPKKPSDGTYKYTFREWSPEISEVTGDVTYTAVFDASPVEINDVDKPVSIYNVLLIVFASVFGILGVGVIVVLVLFIKRMTEK